MAKLSNAIQQDLEVFLQSVKNDERREEDERLRNDLKIIQENVNQALKSLKLQDDSSHSYQIPIWFVVLFTVVGIWAVAATFLVGLVIGNENNSLLPRSDQIEYQISV
ncbi:hypothetical protein [Nodosilinea sp. P-1105]|uniref:hypothetical protein n=1 Tax=Nodosilinea sp. P-1105 TaxID=2546229 RepID=UPI00146E5F7A|nr:hypothetical protein [Nodosilinea sp. P-1105]NMF83347.1 hypothetical protein [Nodosilinea sp. P-1105]